MYTTTVNVHADPASIAGLRSAAMGGRLRGIHAGQARFGQTFASMTIDGAARTAAARVREHAPAATVDVFSSDERAGRFTANVRGAYRFAITADEEAVRRSYPLTQMSAWPAAMAKDDLASHMADMLGADPGEPFDSLMARFTEKYPVRVDRFEYARA